MKNVKALKRHIGERIALVGIGIATDDVIAAWLAETIWAFVAFTAAKIATVSIDDAMDSPAELLTLIDFRLGQVLFVEADVEIIDKFFKRATRLEEELKLILTTISPTVPR